MDVQVLNEIANQVRQASLSQVRASVSANAQLKALKGNLVPAPENPVSPPLEDSPEQAQGPVTPEISSVARAASAYSAAVGDGLNSDELGAIQNLAGRVRTAVSDFLSQPGLEQAENAAAVVASNPDAFQELTASVEQAVVEALNFPEIEGQVIANAGSPIADSFEEGLVPANLISVERVTRGAGLNNPVQEVAADPALVNLPVIENASVENPVPVEGVPETSSGDFTVTAASLALPNAPADENVPVETPVSRPQAIVAPPQESVSRPEPVAANPQEVPVAPASPAVQSVQADENLPVETPVSRPQAKVAPPQESVSRPETVAANPQEVPVAPASPAVQNAQAQNAEVGNPVNIPAPPVDQGQAQAGINPDGAIASPEGASSQTAPGPSNPQPASGPQPGLAPSNDLFAQENAAVNPENIRNANELVNSVVDNEFTSEAKKIFSEPKVIRTVADLADFILERLREIIATKQLEKQSQSSGEIGLS